MCAKLPRLENNPNSLLTSIIKSMIVHRLCSAYNLHAPCMVAKAAGYLLECLKCFPKRFSLVIVIYKDGYPKYYCYNNLQTICIVVLGCNRKTINLNNC